MAEEFQESDVFWPERTRRKEDRLYRSVFQDENVDPAQMVIKNNSSAAQLLKKKKMSKQRNSSQSLPVNIPCNGNQLHCSDSKESDDDFEDAEMVPPHLIVAAGRFERQMAFSVCTGNGTTLKGRDLRRVRNSVLRMTGFLET